MYLLAWGLLELQGWGVVKKAPHCFLLGMSMLNGVLPEHGTMLNKVLPEHGTMLNGVLPEHGTKLVVDRCNALETSCCRDTFDLRPGLSDEYPAKIFVPNLSFFRRLLSAPVFSNPPLKECTIDAHAQILEHLCTPG